MKLSRTQKALAAVAVALAPVVGTFAVGCHPTSHPVTAADLGQARSGAAMEAVIDQPGPVTVETVTGADWAIDRGGLLNLEHPKAKAAGLVDGMEPIRIDLHALRHPARGLYLIDSGVERAMVAAPEKAALRGWLTGFMNLEAMHVKTDTASWIAAQKEPVKGVLLTHLHLDHVLGLPDVPREVPVFVGPGENRERSAMNVVTQGIFDRALEGRGALREMSFAKDPSGTFEGVLDLFGDETVWALWVPGHTEGSVAYVARTPEGPVLFTGDASHTAWGWEHDVEPGTFSHDRARSVESLAKLRAFAARHPAMRVRLGHQALAEGAR